MFEEIFDLFQSAQVVSIDHEEMKRQAEGLTVRSIEAVGLPIPDGVLMLLEGKDKWVYLDICIEDDSGEMIIRCAELPKEVGIPAGVSDD